MYLRPLLFMLIFPLMDARRMLCSVACTHSFDVDYNNAIPKSVMPGRGEGIYEILSVLSAKQ